MEHNRITVSISAIVSLLTAMAAFVPPALAGGPLLSGYGGPGAGAQAIIGATLLNGPGSSSGGGSGGSRGLSSPSGGNASPNGISTGAGTSNGASGVGGGKAANAHGGAHSPGRSAAHPHSGFTQRLGAHSGGATASQSGTTEAALVSAGSPWFSGGDLLALLLAAGALALMAVATVRLARTHHE